MVYMFPSYTFPEHKTYVEVRQSLTFYKYPLYKFLEHRKYNEVGRCLMCCTFPLLESPEHKTYVEVRQMHSNLSKYSNIWNLNRVSNRRPPCITTGKTRRPGVCHPLVDILFQFLNILIFLNLTWVLKTLVISNILNILNILNLDLRFPRHGKCCALECVHNKTNNRPRNVSPQRTFCHLGINNDN